MKIRQINLQKKIISNDAFIDYLIKDDKNTIYLIQEPYLSKKGTIPGLPSSMFQTLLPTIACLVKYIC